MENKELISIPQAAKLLGISRQGMYKKVKNGQIQAIRIGKNYAISLKSLGINIHKKLNNSEKKQINRFVRRVVSQYGETLKMLGDE